MQEHSGPVVYVVATPIGNLEDLTPRARRTLGGVDIVAAEDTRQARKLMTFLAIHGKRLVSYQDHGEAERAAGLIRQIVAEGLSLAIITDAGTPCISDPGYRLVAAAHAAGIKVHPIPGASAPTTLVSASGLPSDRVLFVGFLPTRAGALQGELASWAGTRASIVFFESTRRLGRTLTAIQKVYPEARVAIGRELTKLYEEIVSLDIAPAIAWLNEHATLKGEVTVMLATGAAANQALPGGAAVLTEAALLAQAKRGFARGDSLKDLLGQFKDCGFKRPELYQLLLAAKDSL